MKVMSLPPQQKPNAKRTGKRITFFNDQGSAMKEVSQHTEGPCYVMGAPPSEHTRADPGGAESSGGVAPHMYLNSVIFSPEKGEQNRSHYQQTVKWPHPEPAQQSPATWSQGAPMTAWKQSFPPYLGSQVSYQTQLPESMVLSQEQPQPSSGRMGEKQQQAPNAVGEAFREPTKSLDWVEQQQAFQQSHKTGILNPQQHVAPTTGNTSVLQPFQLAFGQPKQNLATGYYQVFQSNRNLPNLNYGGQASSQHQMQQLQQQQQEQQMQRLMLQRQQQLQAVPHQQQAHQINQLQPPQQMQQHMQQQVQHVPLQKLKSEHLQKLQQNQQVVELRMPKQGFPMVAQSQDTPETQLPQTQDLAPQNPTVAPQPSSDMHQPGAPRRSRRLSKEDAGPPSENPFLATADQQVQDSHSGNPDAGEVAAKKDVQAAPAGVIQSTRRKRRVSQEVNLETLAQKASEMESLPSRKDLLRPWSPSATAPDRGNGEPDVSSAKQTSEESLVPLVIPVSVPVQRAHPLLPELEDGVLSACWAHQTTGSDDPGRPDHKPSVIVTRRRSLRNSLSESSGQNGGTDADGDVKAAKSKRRPRPEPLFIPPPKLGTFIAPAVYSSITPYQSHLRSPVRLPENPLALPPYTPPPILSPVREGSGLYFSAILSAAAVAAASNQGLAPPATPKSATRSLLRSNSTEITPPVLSAMGEATPVSIEPRINIGQRYQAEVPELKERSEVLLDPHKAELVWAPLTELDGGGPQQQRVDDLMHLACSSALCGGGTNQELAMHCLYECKGDIMEALGLLLLKKPIFPRPHPLADYHYSGSDSWTPEERRIFNKGIGTYKKDFFMVQKMVSTKTVAQCVEFYYTYKKQVKIGRNGTLMYGDTEVHETRPTEEEVDYKSSQRFDLRKEEEDNRKWEGSGDRKQRESSPGRVTQSLQATESAGAVLVLRNQDDGKRDPAMFGMSHAPTVPPKPRSEGTARKNGGGAKVPVGQEGEFPCKKCGRVFFKVKSRSAHMKSHAEQEKKAAALRQREAEERAAALARAAVMAAQQNGSRGEQAAARRGSSEDSSEEDGEDVDDDDWL